MRPRIERRNTPEHEPVGLSDIVVPGVVNLRARVRRIDGDGAVVVDDGLDAFYMQEGTAAPIERAIGQGRVVQMEVAVASSGRARIRTLLVDGRADQAGRGVRGKG